jgi:hypothetical protein
MILFCVSHFVKALQAGALPAAPHKAGRLARRPPVNSLRGATNNLAQIGSIGLKIRLTAYFSY